MTYCHVTVEHDKNELMTGYDDESQHIALIGFRIADMTDK